jgi:hypothetical protein
MGEGSPTELVLEVPVQLDSPAGESALREEPDRRSHPRLTLGLWAHCQIDGIVSQEALGDLSAGGLYLRTTAQVREGARARIVLGLPYIGGQRVCSLSGSIAWVDVQPDGALHGAGVRFDQETDSADHQLLEGFLALWGSPRAAP